MADDFRLNGLRDIKETLRESDRLYRIYEVVLDELIAETTPEKPQNIYKHRNNPFSSEGETVGRCPRCYKTVKVGDYKCSSCGQALDWSEADAYGAKSDTAKDTQAGI